MTADLLTRAATLIRERAQAAEHGRWKLWGMSVMADPAGTSNVDDAILVAASVSTPSTSSRRLHTGNAEHIASWHPAVALAVADWLDEAGSTWDSAFDEHWLNTARAWDKNNNAPMTSEVRAHFRSTAAEFADGRSRAALAVARAYLSEGA